MISLDRAPVNDIQKHKEIKEKEEEEQGWGEVEALKRKVSTFSSVMIDRGRILNLHGTHSYSGYTALEYDVRGKNLNNMTTGKEEERDGRAGGGGGGDNGDL